ncbi:MAG: hypothetical protein V4597_11580 [Pseudomonadota bacterium]
MAKDNEKRPDVVEVPAALWQQLQTRLETLEHAERIRQEAGAFGPAKVILDPAYEAWKMEAARPAQARSQDVADRRYGTAAPRFRCRLDSTAPDGKPGPAVGEHPELVVSAHSDLEAQARYLELAGIRKHDYRVVALPVAA